MSLSKFKVGDYIHTYESVIDLDYVYFRITHIQNGYYTLKVVKSSGLFRIRWKENKEYEATIISVDMCSDKVDKDTIMMELL